MQHQDFERDGDFYQPYDKQKVQLQSHRTPQQPFTLQDLVKMFCAVVGIFLPFVFVAGMLSGNGRVWMAAELTCIVAIGLACIAAIVLLGFGIAQIVSTSYNLIRKKMTFSQTERS